jgi:ABC-type nitrate/sulfonate/bicarbonate transport system ATPase subunit
MTSDERGPLMVSARTVTVNAMITLSALTFAYPSGPVIFQRFSWRVARGEAWAVIGASGCGKSTLLMLIAGLRHPTTGSALVDGAPLLRPRPRTGLILQDYGLLPWATVWDNAALGLKIRRFYGPDGVHTPVDEDLKSLRERVDYWLERLNIVGVADQYPSQISGGQRQRTAIARTLVLQPDLLLMDEPFGALDAMTREDLQKLTLELHAEQGLTTLLVTHNIEEAAAMGHKILVLGQPPHREPVIVHNPEAGRAGYRASPAYLAQCNHLRSLLGDSVRALA